MAILFERDCIMASQIPDAPLENRSAFIGPLSLEEGTNL